jgi:hypothetical protein
MPSISEILGNPIKEILGAANDIIGRFITDPDKRLAAQTELVRLQSDLQAKLIDADARYAEAQAKVITAELRHGTWLSRSWRPITMLVFVYIIAHNYILATMFHLESVPIPTDMWDLLKIGIGGYVIGRSVEKTAPAIAGAIAEAKK